MKSLKLRLGIFGIAGIDARYPTQRASKRRTCGITDLWVANNTKSLAKEFSEILIFEYFGCLKMVFDVFFDADSESTHMT